ncbi:hypothetical protein [Streptomyces adustus]
MPTWQGSPTFKVSGAILVIGLFTGYASIGVADRCCLWCGG